MRKLILTACLLGSLSLAHAEITEARAKILPAKGEKVTGVVTFRAVEGGVEVVANIEGLKPGNHGFHIHEKGDCSAPDFSSAGGHFNPEVRKHGGPEAAERHVGDLGNLIANQEGKAHYQRIDPLLKLNGDHSIIDKSVVIHSDPDDYVTQPTGNSGGRLGCGVIETIKPRNGS